MVKMARSSRRVNASKKVEPKKDVGVKVQAKQKAQQAILAGEEESSHVRVRIEHCRQWFVER